MSLLLLSLRALVVGMMTWWSSRWASSAEGRSALAAMDAAISALFDPHGYHAALAPLQASAAGVHALQAQRALPQYHCVGGRGVILAIGIRTVS